MKLLQDWYLHILSKEETQIEATTSRRVENKVSTFISSFTVDENNMLVPSVLILWSERNKHGVTCPLSRNSCLASETG